MGMDIGTDIKLVGGHSKGWVAPDCTGSTGRCGACAPCQRSASKVLADMVIKWRYTDRGRKFPSDNTEEQRYAANLLKRLLAMMGLPGGDEPLCPECARAKEARCSLCVLGARGGPGPTAQSEPGPPVHRMQGNRSPVWEVVDEATQVGRVL